MYELCHFTSKSTMRKDVSIIIWLPYGVGPGQDQPKCALRRVDECCTLEICIRSVSSVQAVTSLNRTKLSVTAIQGKLRKRGVKLEDVEIVGLEEGLTDGRVSTAHGVQSEGFIPFGFACTNK